MRLASSRRPAAPLRWRLAVLAAVAVSSLVTRAGAHAMRTASLRVDETTPTRSVVRFTTTLAAAGVAPSLPPDCDATPADAETAAARTRVWTLACPGGLRGKSFGVSGLGPLVDDAVVFVAARDGQRISHRLTPEEPEWTVPLRESAVVVAAGYTRAGLLHIAAGVDHLLFLVLLVLILRRPRAVLLAETAFTASHSVSFAATALGWVRVASAPAEACIALSLVLLALDAARPAAAAPGRVACSAFAFGLVHGLGFAGGLRELGLPDEHVAVALLGFGAGVEIGQVAFLALLLATMSLLTRARPDRRWAQSAATGIGGLATAWLVERLVSMLSTST